MKKKNCWNLYASLFMLIVFILWTLAVRFIDVQAIGPLGSKVGFSKVNYFAHELTGVNMMLYHITDWLGFVPIFVALGFATFGIAQWIKRKRLGKVDYDIFILGGFYIIVMTIYIVFEIVVINMRPVLINGILEVSYPSSTTLLVICVMSTAIMQFNSRIKSSKVKKVLVILIKIFIIFMVIGRLVSGVHWFTDIVGGILLSTSLVMMYRYVAGFKKAV